MKKIKNITLTKIETPTPAVKETVTIDQAWPWPQEITNILDAIRSNAYVVLNKHNNKPEPMRVGVWLHRSRPDAERQWADWYVCAMPGDGSMCCLNPIYVGKDGVPYLSTASVGDNVYAGFGNPKFYPERDFQTGMAAYNWRYMETEEKHGFPKEFLCTPLWDNRLLYAEGRHEKFIWNEDTEEVKKIRF